MQDNSLMYAVIGLAITIAFFVMLNDISKASKEQVRLLKKMVNEPVEKEEVKPSNSDEGSYIK